MTERHIQMAVARADVLICSVLRRLPAVAVLAGVLLLAILFARERMEQAAHWIDYDAPGVDITSEGPDDDYTENWYKRGGDEP